MSPLGKMPLHEAVRHGLEGVVEILFQACIIIIIVIIIIIIIIVIVVVVVGVGFGRLSGGAERWCRRRS